MKGHLVDVRPDNLAAHVVSSVMHKVPQLEPAMVEDLLCGCGLPGGEQGFNLARVVSILSHLNSPGVTVNRYCSSSLATTRIATHAIHAGEGDVFLSVGVECVSRFGNGTPTRPTREPALAPGNPEGYPDIYISMGQTAENVAGARRSPAKSMDRFAVKSQTPRCRRATIRILRSRDHPGAAAQRRDLHQRRQPAARHDRRGARQLKPAFREDGTVTAGNACPLNDGAAAVVLMSDRRAQASSVSSRLPASSRPVSALAPEFMGLGPVDASRQALKRAAMTIDDIDIVEINEAFAAQVIPSARGMGIDPFGDKLNPHGGAIALGHPFGMTGARILCTLLNELTALEKQTYGLETMCVGGGQGMAMIVERLS